MKTQRYARSAALRRRATTLIPGGFHLSGRPLLGADDAPLYFERGSGGRIRDVDGHEYVDFIMAYGPYLLGYAHPEVDAAVAAQAGRGGLLSLNHPMHLDFMEALLKRFPQSRMGAFFRTGSEATTAALRIARRVTGRRLVARCGYHGWHDWCLPDADFVPDGLGSQVHGFDARDPGSLRTLLESRPGAFAAVILASEMIHPPDRAAIVALMQAARAHGALFVMDEVKTGIRAPNWSMQAWYGVEADITTLSKALGNGWPIAATIGRREIMEQAAGMHLSATYHGDTTAMAAAMATMDIIERDRVQERVRVLGERLIAGLNAAAMRHGVPAEAYGEPMAAMPFLRFVDPDPAVNAALSRFVYASAMREGILLHPRHLWFVCAAHTEDDIDRSVDVVDRAMGAARDAVARDCGAEAPAVQLVTK